MRLGGTGNYRRTNGAPRKLAGFQLPYAPRVPRDPGPSPRRRPQPAERAPSGPLQILDERFARGEIDDEEYRRRRAVLRGDP